ncbi:MAG TPA: acylphosphatase [Terriglobales bacterium]
MNPNPIVRRYVVSGRVQGVGFRWFVEWEARSLGIGGWVRNTADGNVEVLASGSAGQLEKLKSKLQQGPRAARVDQVSEADAADAAAEIKGKSFVIEGAW